MIHVDEILYRQLNFKNFNLLFSPVGALILPYGS